MSMRAAEEIGLKWTGVLLVAETCILPLVVAFSELLGSITGFVAARLGVLLECETPGERLRDIAGGVAPSEGAEFVESESSEDGLVTIDAFEDLRTLLGWGVKDRWVWVTLRGDGVAEDELGGGDRVVASGREALELAMAEKARPCWL